VQNSFLKKIISEKMSIGDDYSIELEKVTNLTMTYDNIKTGAEKQKKQLKKT